MSFNFQFFRLRIRSRIEFNHVPKTKELSSKQQYKKLIVSIWVRDNMMQNLLFEGKIVTNQKIFNHVYYFIDYLRPFD